MLRFILLLSIMLSVGSVSAQVVAVQFDKGYIAYIGVDNPITIAVEGYACSALVVTVDNGSIDHSYGQNGTDGYYTINPQYPGDSMTINVQVRTPKGMKDIQKYKVKLECLTPHGAYLSYHSGGDLNLYEFLNYTCLSGNIHNCHYMDDPIVTVTGYNIALVRDGVVLFSKGLFGHEKEFRFIDDEEVAEMIKSVVSGDKIRFSNITYRGPGKCTGVMKAIEFTLK